MSARRWRRLAALVQNNEVPRTDVGAGVEVSTENHFLVLYRPPVAPVIHAAPDPAEPIALAVPGSTSVPWAGGRVVTTVHPGEPGDESIDLDRLSLPLSVRAPAPGDRFAPLGMGGRSMPLADFFRGRGVSLDRRRPHPARLRPAWASSGSSAIGSPSASR